MRTQHRVRDGLLAVVVLTMALTPRPSGGADAPSPGVSPASRAAIFVIVMENHDAAQIYGNASDAPFLDHLRSQAAIATSFQDELPIEIPSEPHYVWMEAGTNQFADHTFLGDGPPSSGNSTADTDHLVTQIKDSHGAVDWRSYQEGLNVETGACPVASSGFYFPKHDPFVFFQDVAGAPPAKTNPYCAAHHAPLSKLAGDLASAAVATYDFITPDQCHDMHGQTGCPEANVIKAGDDWLAASVPPLVEYVNAHGGVVFIVWDEGVATSKLPFFALGPDVKAGSASDVKYTHGSLLKSIDLMLGLPVLDRVADASDLGDLFVGGQLPKLR